MFQFFADLNCGESAGGILRLSPALLRHVRAARIGPAEDFAVVLPGGRALRVRLEGAPKGSARVLGEIERIPESRLALSYYLGLAKPDVLEAAISGATELGVAEISLVTFSRSPPSRFDASRKERLGRIAQHAAEVAGRARIPVISDPLSFEEAAMSLSAFRGPRFLLWEETARSAPSLARLLREGAPSERAALVTGPEGGITAAEAGQLRAAGCQLASLGPRILKAHTAPLTALAIAQALWGDLT